MSPPLLPPSSDISAVFFFFFFFHRVCHCSVLVDKLIVYVYPQVSFCSLSSILLVRCSYISFLLSLVLSYLDSLFSPFFCSVLLLVSTNSYLVEFLSLYHLDI